MPYPRENFTTLTSAPAVNEEAVVTSATPEANMRMKLVSLFCGYGSGTLSGGLITITDTVVTMKLYVPAAGIQILPLEWVGAPGKPIKVSLAAGGAAVQGSINATFTID